MLKRIMLVNAGILSGLFGCQTPSGKPVDSPADRAAADPPGVTAGSAEGDGTNGDVEDEDAETLEVADPRPCRGAATEELVYVLSMRAAQSRSCYNEMLREGVEKEGRMVVRLLLQSNGELAEEPLIVEDQIQNEALSSCVVGVMKTGAPEAPPKGGCLFVNVPLNFQVKKKEDE